MLRYYREQGIHMTALVMHQQGQLQDVPYIISEEVLLI